MNSRQTEGALGGLSSEPKLRPELTRVGKYRVDGVIGRGAIGIVYRGHDEQIDRPLAIKTLRLDVLANVADRDNLLQRFAAEARSAGRCRRRWLRADCCGSATGATRCSARAGCWGAR